eukprot:647733-Pyramimonas_sp.AAC.1
MELRTCVGATPTPSMSSGSLSGHTPRRLLSPAQRTYPRGLCITLTPLRTSANGARTTHRLKRCGDEP